MPTQNKIFGRVVHFPADYDLPGIHMKRVIWLEYNCGQRGKYWDAWYESNGIEWPREGPSWAYSIADERLTTLFLLKWS